MAFSDIDWSKWANVATDLYGAYNAYQGAQTTKNAAQTAAQSTVISPYSSSSPFGSAVFNPASRTISFNATSPFGTLFNQLGLASLANAGVANSMPFNGANPELLAALGQANDAANPNSDIATNFLSQLRAVAAPQEQRNAIALDNQQFARGTLGTTGGAQRYQAMLEANNQADLQRQLAATQYATQIGNDRFSRALQTVNQGMQGQAQQYSIGAGSFGGIQQLLQSLFSQAQLGIGSGGGVAPAAAINAADQAGAPNAAVGQFLSSPAFRNILGQVTPAPQVTIDPSTQAALNQGQQDFINYGNNAISDLNNPVTIQPVTNQPVM